MKPSLEAVTVGTYNPLSRPLFVYVSKKSADTRPEVKQFIEFSMKNSIPLIKEVKYLPLPEAAYQSALKKFNEGKTGSVFGGVPEVGVSIDSLMKREAKS